MIYMFLSNNPSSGDINSSNLSCFTCISSRSLASTLNLACANDVTCSYDLLCVNDKY